ncbi:hypothetical protein GCM10011581_05060 [Saccharopolyspora subtropica]|uniref:Uncharacterized protein n=2 Tax=Saccharopolyspora thermophila TaxID=89367 RepID=A0A917JLI6_9PSEU|nr:hypothetical protein GCM10011581_05060 [Saccharopolyspora subtropica]
MGTPPAASPHPPRTRRLPEAGDQPRPQSGGRHALHPPKPPTRIGTTARTLTGALAAGSLVFAVGLVVVQFWTISLGQQGPGVAAVISQLVTALAAVALQTVADRRRDAVGGAATLAAFALVIGSLWFWWW